MCGGSERKKSSWQVNVIIESGGKVEQRKGIGGQVEQWTGGQSPAEIEHCQQIRHGVRRNNLPAALASTF